MLAIFKEFELKLKMKVTTRIAFEGLTDMKCLWSWYNMQFIAISEG